MFYKPSFVKRAKLNLIHTKYISQIFGNDFLSTHSMFLPTFSHVDFMFIFLLDFQLISRNLKSAKVRSA